ncbi:MAG TPA: TIGR01777 family oxidoreductase [Thermomicrobiales bacterium]|nr:TIGR01777 family oxidoreductase [Thermomicrobiales bacterium]
MARQRIVVTGSSGLVGTRLVPYLEFAGYDVIRLVRRKPTGPSERYWNPLDKEIDQSALDGAFGVINMAGVSIADKRWSASTKQAIYNSRVNGTRLLASAIANSPDPPTVLVSTSAVGFYGDGGSTVLTEASENGSGFLADVCEAWESAADSARDVGIRVVHPRFGIVMAGEGGMLPRIARLFRLGLGGRIGDGEQFMSWIDLDDLVRVLLYSVESKGSGEIINAVSPNPVTNREFTEALAETLHRPAIIPVPEFGVRIALGQMGEELVLVSQRAIPLALEKADFQFLYPTIQGSLRHELHPDTSARNLPAREIDVPAVTDHRLTASKQ